MDITTVGTEIMIADIRTGNHASRGNRLAAWALALCPVLAGALHAQTFPLDVKIDAGELTGVPTANPAVTVFKGVPFAAPPVGALRWKPPVVPTKWSGVRKSDKYGSCLLYTSDAADE